MANADGTSVPSKTLVSDVRRAGNDRVAVFARFFVLHKGSGFQIQFEYLAGMRQIAPLCLLVVF